MKPITLIIIIIVGMLSFSCTSDDQMLTVVNPDGSCSREFVRNADSAFMVGDTSRNNPFPINIDSTWNISWIYLTPEIHTNWPVKNWKWDATDTSKKISVTARHNFDKVEDMATGFRLKTSHEWNNLKIKYSLDKKFRWFYTYYNYKEIYPKIKTFDDVPFEKYMTKEEAEFWFTGNPDLTKGMNGVEIREYAGELEDKYNLWFAHNYWNAEYKNLLATYDQLKIKTISKQRLELARDSAFKKYSSLNKIGEMDLKMDSCLDDYFKTKIFSSLRKTGNSPFEKFEKDMDSLSFINYFTKSFDYKLLMPGKVTNSSNSIIHGDTLTWKLTAYRMVYSDYEINAQSRKTNLWAFLVSGLIVVLAIGSFFYKSSGR
jgi:hypothetical protein